MARNGRLAWYEKPFGQYLPRKGRILEAGCGLGQWVLALRARGYEAEGVEWSTKTVDEVRRLVPDLPIRAGDVRQLDVPDGYYAAYISLGVVEHVREGPESFLQEAHRVLTPGGVILIAVPRFHVLRRLKARLGMYPSPCDGTRFYQYAFTHGEFLSLLSRYRFKVERTFGCYPTEGFLQEIPLIANLVGLRFIGTLLKSVCGRVPPICCWWPAAVTEQGWNMNSLLRKQPGKFDFPSAGKRSPESASQLFLTASLCFGWFLPRGFPAVKAEIGMEQAATRRRLFHLWFHPFNLATSPGKLLRGLEEIFARVREYREVGLLDNPTMGELARFLNGEQQP
jgi:SAM-dependent methyltransferase